MTTLKEYKAMMEGATDAPLIYQIPQIEDSKDVDDAKNHYWEIKPLKYQSGANYLCVTGWMKEATAARLAISYNITPELIRVIELAEESLNSIVVMGKGRYNQGSRLVTKETLAATAQHALSEIRKLKGE